MQCKNIVTVNITKIECIENVTGFGAHSGSYTNLSDWSFEGKKWINPLLNAICKDCQPVHM